MKLQIKFGRDTASVDVFLKVPSGRGDDEPWIGLYKGDQTVLGKSPLRPGTEFTHLCSQIVSGAQDQVTEKYL